MSKTISIGLFGFGCVGQGLYDVLEQSSGFRAQIKKICVKDRTKKRKLPEHFFTFEKDVILNDDSINLVIELIDNAEEAFAIVKTAMLKGKDVVTANKKMIATHFNELLALQQETGVSLLYEASACGSIPIIRNLEEYYDNELLNSVSGIFNGSTNYILSNIFNSNISYADALKQAQDLGFAESDPTLDVGAFDPKFKLVIIAAHAFGLFIKPEKVFNYGIEQLSNADIQYAREKGFKIKLVATARKVAEGKVTLFVVPSFIRKEEYLHQVENEFNAVILEGAFSDKQYLTGKGAGGHPTGSAVLSDISALRYNYRYEYRKHRQDTKAEYSSDVLLKIYFRFNSEADLDLLHFKTIEQQFRSSEFSYVVGTVELNELISRKKQLQTNGLFFAWTGELIENLPKPGSSIKLKETEYA